MSAADWLPALPQGWVKGQLRWLAKIYSGGTPSREEAAFWSEGTVPWLASGAVNQWVVTTPSEYITEEAVRLSSTRWVPERAVVMGLAGQGKTKGTVARTAIRATCNQSMCAIAPRSNLNYRYLHFWLYINHENIRNLAGGDKRDGLNHTHVGNIVVPLPPLTAQRAIADYLDRETAQIDALIEKQRALIDRLRERRTAFRVAAALGHDLQEVWESGLPWARRVPAHWEVVPLTSVSTLGSGHTPSKTRPELWIDAHIPWISLRDVSVMTGAEYIYDTHTKISQAGIAASSARLLPKDTVVLSRDATVGRSVIMGAPMATSQHFVTWTCGPRLVPSYLWLLMTGAMQPFFESLTDGATLKTIGMGDVRSFRVPLPPLAEQAEITKRTRAETSKIDLLIAKSQRFIDLARERRSALITAAVTGQIDITEAEAA